MNKSQIRSSSKLSDMGVLFLNVCSDCNGLNIRHSICKKAYNDITFSVKYAAKFKQPLIYYFDKLLHSIRYNKLLREKSAFHDLWP